jgi:hypothetical protein
MTYQNASPPSRPGGMHRRGVCWEKKASNRHESPPRGAAQGRGVGLWRIPQTMEYAADRAEHTLCEDAAG